jgi:putative FmdB family regulatory protein
MHGTVTYEYRCRDCKTVTARQFEFLHHPDTIACPKCRGICTRTFTQVPRVHFKGWDWTSKNLWDPMDPRNDNPLNFDDIEVQRKKVFTPS